MTNLSQFTSDGTMYYHMLKLYDIDFESLDSDYFLQTILVNTAHIINASIKDISFIKFEPFGVSGVLLIGESHIACHSWPDLGTLQVLIATCSKKMNVDAGIEYILKKTGCIRFDRRNLTI